MLRITAGALGALMSLYTLAQAPALPKSPVTLNVVDVAGNLALTQEAIESYRAKNPKLVSRVTFTKAPAPELPGKLKAMQAAKRVDIDLVLTGTDALAAGIEQGLWTPILPTHAAKCPNLLQNYQDPVNGWEKTWAYLKELNSCIEYYPTGTGAVMKELGEGSRDMTVTMTGWDLNPRILGIVPKNFKVNPFKGMTWVNDAHYMVAPKGIPQEKLAVVLDLMAWLLRPESQALTYDKGYFYPGPAVKNVTLSMA